MTRPMTRPAPSFPPIEELLPHRGTMLLLDRIIAGDEHSITAVRTVPAEGWYLDDQDAMPGWIGLELMAQAVAAHAGLRARMAGGPVKKGVLLGAKALRASHPAFAAGDRLRVCASLVYRDESGLAAYDCTIASAAGAVATATLKVFEPADFDAFLQGSLT